MINLDSNFLLHKKGDLAIYLNPESNKEHFFYIGNFKYALKENMLQSLSASQERVLSNIQALVPDAYKYLNEKKVSPLEIKDLIDKAYHSKNNLAREAK